MELTEELIQAVMDNDVDRVNDLLAEGADPNGVLDVAMITPLHFAAQNNSLFVIPLLIEAGADINARTSPEGATPIDIALLHGHDKVTQTLMAYQRHSDCSEQ